MANELDVFVWPIFIEHPTEQISLWPVQNQPSRDDRGEYVLYATCQYRAKVYSDGSIVKIGG